MPKNKGGKRFKKGKKGNSNNDDSMGIVPEADPQTQVYAIVEKREGGQWLRVKCSDGTSRQCFIRGKFRKRIWMNAGDLILVSLRTDLSDTNKCDVEHKYRPREANYLRSKGHLDFIKDDTDTLNNILFGSGGDEEEEEQNDLIPAQRIVPTMPESDDEDIGDIDLDDI